MLLVFLFLVQVYSIHCKAFFLQGHLKSFMGKSWVHHCTEVETVYVSGYLTEHKCSSTWLTIYEFMFICIHLPQVTPKHL